jgi:ribosomal protein S18 acetylase RimI-like enzyme
LNNPPLTISRPQKNVKKETKKRRLVMATRKANPQEPMSLYLRPGRPEDVPNFVVVYFSAFAANKLTQAVFPESSPQARAFWRDSLAEEINDPNARFLVVEDASTSPPTFVAFAKWNFQGPGVGAQPLPSPDIWPKDGDPDAAVRFFSVLWNQHEKIMHGRPHWYLELIATMKEFQGKGAGGMLMKWGVDRADEDGWECYLDSTPDGIQLYEKYGFREVETLQFLDGAYAQCFMLRPAKGT